MSTISKPYTFSAGAVIVASEHNSNFDTIYNDHNGGLTTVNLSASAAIVDTQLAQITTASKVSVAALTNFSNFTTVTAVSNDYVAISDTSDSGNNKKALASDLIFVPSASNALSGSVIQVVSNAIGTVVNCNSSIPFDDTTPQNTEGVEVVTLAITPTSATNKLRIDFSGWGGSSGANTIVIAALFQDTTANSLAANATQATSTSAENVVLSHYMTSGTTSSTTFKIRVGVSTGSFYVNGDGSGNARFNALSATRITISEIKV